MPKQEAKWVVHTTSKKAYKLTGKEYKLLMEAISAKARFVEFDNFTLNLAYVTEINKVFENILT